MRDILATAGVTDKLKEISFDSASEFLSKDMRDFLRHIGPNENGVTIHVKQPNRDSRQDISDLDAKMGTFSRQLTLLRQQSDPDAEVKTLAWLPYIAEAVEFSNMKRVKHGRAMGIAPNKAAESFAEAKEGAEASAKQVSGFVLQDRAAEDREHNREVQNKAHEKLADPKNRAFRAKIPPRSTQRGIRVRRRPSSR